MSPSKRAGAVARTPTLGSRDREVASLAASRLSGWDACSVGDHAAHLSGGDKLTARERDVLAMISQGLSNKRAARALGISPETVKSHVKRIFLKLTVSTRAEAVSRASSLGLLPSGVPTPTASRDEFEA